MAAVTTLPKARFLSLVLNENKEDSLRVEERESLTC